MLSFSILREGFAPPCYEVDRERKLSLQRVSKQNLLHHCMHCTFRTNCTYRLYHMLEYFNGQPVYMIKTKVAFLEGRLLSSQSEQSENLIGWKKAGPPKSHFCFDHVNNERQSRGPACLHDQNKSGFFWRAGFYSANQSNLKSFQKALIGWKIAGPPKQPLLL